MFQITSSGYSITSIRNQMFIILDVYMWYRVGGDVFR